MPPLSVVPKVPFAWLWMALPSALVALAVWTSADFPLDYWVHVVCGREMWQTGRPIETDVFTHAVAGAPVLNQPWLSQLAMYGLSRLGGFPLVQFVAGLIYAAAIGLIVVIARRRGAWPRMAALGALLAWPALMANCGVRPQAVSALLFSAELYVLWNCHGNRAIVAVAAMSALWVNLHGAFPLAVALPAVFLAGDCVERWLDRGPETQRRARRWPVYLGACLAAGAGCLANPRGLGVLEHVTGVSAASRGRGVEEWLPPALDTVSGAALALGVVVAIVTVVASRRRLTATEGLLLLALTSLALASQRMVLWWALAMPTALAPHWADILSRGAGAPTVEPPRRRHVAAMALGLMWLIWTTPWMRSANPLLPAFKRVEIPPDEPAGAAAFLQREALGGRLYQPMEWGSYLTWRLGDRVQVFADSRMDVFPDDVWQDYLAIGAGAEGALALLDRWRVGLVVWDPRRPSQLPQRLEHSHAWRRLYRDHNSLVYVRRASSPPQSASRR